MIVGGALYDNSDGEAWRLDLNGYARSWRNAVNGAWQYPGNWMPWGKPGPNSFVNISPTGSATVTGPEMDVSVAGLTIGATSGIATLVLDQGGDVMVAGTLNVSIRGALQQAAGELSANSFYNSGTLSQTGGLIEVSTFTNTGTAEIGGTLVATTDATNRHVLILEDGTIGRGYDPFGGFPSGPFTNDYGASLTGRGAIRSSFYNHGSMVATGVLTVGDAFLFGTTMTNDGQVSLPALGVLQLAQGRLDQHRSNRDERRGDRRFQRRVFWHGRREPARRRHSRQRFDYWLPCTKLRGTDSRRCERDAIDRRHVARLRRERRQQRWG